MHSTHSLPGWTSFTSPAKYSQKSYKNASVEMNLKICIENQKDFKKKYGLGGIGQVG